MDDASYDQTTVEHAYQKWARVYDTRKENWVSDEDTDQKK